MNLLFITFPKAVDPFVVAYDLDSPESSMRQWRACAREVKYSVFKHGMKGAWGYLRDEMWIRLTQDEAYARYPALREEIELYEAIEALE